jgi:hypothetical protein
LLSRNHNLFPGLNIDMVTENKKMRLAKLGMGTLLVFAGIVIGAIGVLVLLLWSGPDAEELEAIRLQDTVEYIQGEQERIGFDCSLLAKEIRDFLHQDLRPMLDTRQPGQDWNGDVSADVRERMGELQDRYSVCGRLYAAARNGKWDGMKDLAFAVELDRDIIVLNTLIRFGEFGSECDALCLDGNFRELRDAFARIEARLAQTP